MNRITKVSFFIGSVGLLVLLFLFSHFLLPHWCDLFSIKQCYIGSRVEGAIGLLALSVAGLTIPFSIVTFFLPERVFTSWKRFAVFVAPIVVILMLFIDHYWGGGALPGQGAYAGLFIIVLYALYVLASFVIIGVSAWRNQRNPAAVQ